MFLRNNLFRSVLKKLIPCFILTCAMLTPALAAKDNPYDRQIDEQLQLLQDTNADVRNGAAEALGYLRSVRAAGALERALKDSSATVRQQAALSLGWCGGRKQVDSLLAALDDKDWTVRQSAWVALTNLTGIQWPFDALAKPAKRQSQAKKWRSWWASVKPNEIPTEILDLLQQGSGNINLAAGCEVTATSTYKGPASILTDGNFKGEYFQSKNVPFPQSCMIDLGKAQDIGSVIVHQYGPGFCMTEYQLSISRDGQKFDTITRKKESSSPTLTINFDQRKARYVRITSFASQTKTYPTTFYEIEVMTEPPPKEPTQWYLQCGIRALGALGGDGAIDHVIEIIKPFTKRTARSFAQKSMIQTGLSSLGRLSGEQATEVLIEFLENPQWARYAASALGDIGGRSACAALLKAYPDYARNINRANPKLVPIDDRPGLDPSDRMYETPYAIALSLMRMPDSFNNEMLAQLRELLPILAANIPSNFDGAIIYQPQSFQKIYGHLIELSGMRDTVSQAAFQALGISDRKAKTKLQKSLLTLAQTSPGDVPNAAVWLPVICQHKQYVPQLVELLQHENGWVRINAAQTLMFMNEKNAIAPLTKILTASKPEAEYGYNGKFFFKAPKWGQAEYNDTPPRWRQAYVYALGALNAKQTVPLLIDILNDDQNVLEVQYAAAEALDKIGTGKALKALQNAEAAHPFASIKLFAREALWKREIPPLATDAPPAKPITVHDVKAQTYPVYPPAIVFIKGDNSMPNDFQIDIWRTTYSTTDSGPTYRLGKNLYVLRPAGPNGKVTQLTHFKQGYIADCEVSWDGSKIIFTHRGADADPWWHVYEINADGSGMYQLTYGPYHDVQPAYMGDGRIIFSSSRIGMRDEYHGYPATGLTVMNGDGTDIHCIGFNLGRDNEPAVLPDGRIVFSRLELFYSRLKTELTLHSVFPDGTKNVTLYGPERRDFWRQVTRNSGEKWWGEVPPRHRVLRLTQPQYFDNQRLICSTTGGATLIGPGRLNEKILPRDQNRSVTSPFPLSDGRVLCASTERTFERKDVDLGLYILDSDTGKLTLLYNDPDTAEFEPRPLMPRPRPIALAAGETNRSQAYTGSFFCQSVFESQEARVALRGKLVRVVEGLPVVARHHTHLSKKGEAWKNHTGTHARVLGTVPLAADGSFFVNIPADRLVHFQVLDSDRTVVGNQQIWMYARPGETRGCVGCHEKPDMTASTKTSGFPQAARTAAIDCLPTGGEFSYRAKFWNKGTLTDEGEERTRTVRAVNLIAR